MSIPHRGFLYLAANYLAVATRRAIFPLLGPVVVAFLWTSSSSCTGHVRTQAVVAYPSLVYVEPGLWVVAESDRPIFYYDSYYWLFQDGYWYRSAYYTGGWVHLPTARLPPSIVHIRRPRIYRNYRARPGQRVRKAPTREHRRTRDTRPPRRSPPPRRRTRPKKSSP